MDTKPILSFLSNIPLGTIVGWLIVILGIISGLCAGTIKLYKLFTKYRDMKDKNEKQTSVIESHEKTLKEIEASLRTIQTALVEQRDVNLKQVRYTIIRICEEALERKEISTNKLRSLEEMYDEYVDIFHGNGYVKTLVKRVRKEVTIIGDE